MKLIDTHTHLYLKEFQDDLDEVVKRAIDNGIEKLLLPNIDYESVDPMLRLSNRFPGVCLPMIGLHPTSVKEDFISQLEMIGNISHKHDFIAVGEIGIDLYWDKTFLKEQITAFRRQINLAIEKQLPVVIHSREAFPEVFSVLNEFKGHLPRGVFHAFSGDISQAQIAIEMGFLLGIGGVVTFKNSRLDTVIFETGIEHLILETDSPYLSPVPHRGKRNESSYICLINKKIAGIFNITEEEAATITYENSLRLFNI
jgi:TatD DNase family protein